MFSLALAFLVWAFLTCVGQAVQALLNLKFGVLRSWLLAPGIGLAVVVLALMVGNQAGRPVNAFAWLLAGGLALASIGVLAWKRPSLPWRALAPFVLAVLASLFWTAWPALKFGFHWISYVNDDFTNYCLAAERFKDSGFYQVPAMADLAGRDYTRYYWFMHALQLFRFGAEHMLAWISALTGKAAVQVFMPTIVMFGLVQISALGALVLQAGRHRRHAQWACVLLAFSPLFMLGSLYQLLAQVGGMGLLLTLVAMLTARLSTRRRLRVLAYAVPSALAGAALCVFYPEETGFALLAAGLYFGAEWLRDRRFPGARVILLEYSLVGVLVILRSNLISYIYTLCNQLVGGTKHVDLSLSLFPFFLIPSGLASLFGLQTLSTDVPNPWGSILIAAGLVLLLVCIFAALRGTLRAVPFACLLLVQLVMAIGLYRTGNDFGLYKMAMWMQPGLMAALAGCFLFARRRPWPAAIAAAVLIGAGAHAGFGYARASLGATSGVLTEVKGASDALQHIPAKPAVAARWSSNIDNVSAAKLAAADYRGVDLKFLCRYYFYSVFLPAADWPLMSLYPHRDLFALGRNLNDRLAETNFVQRSILTTSFTETVEAEPPEAYLNLPSHLNLFNKLHSDGASSGQLFVLQPAANARNLLAFIHSDRGNQYYLGDRRKISFYQQEPDPFTAHGDFNAIGRYLLLRVENPSDPLYLRLAITKTLMGSGRTSWSASAEALAQRDVPLDLVGSGAANRIAGPIEPVWLDGCAYIAIDFNQAPVAFPFKRTGLKALYNTDINLDYRRLLAYARDISALSKTERNALVRPRRIAQFPDDLVRAVGLEFSGIYEDGWLSPQSNFIMGSSHAGEMVRLKGYVPELVGGRAEAEMEVSVNRGTPFRLTLKPGPFDWLLPVANPGAETRLDLASEGVGALPGKDGRPVVGKLESLEILAFPSDRFDLATIGSPRPPTVGIDQDGWAAAKAEIQLAVGPAVGGVRIEFEYPGWPGVPEKSSVRLSLGGGAPVSLALNPGTNSIVLPVKPGPPVRRLSLEGAKTFLLPAPDGRERTFQILSVAGVAEAGPR